MSSLPPPESDQPLTPLTEPSDGLTGVVDTPAALAETVGAFGAGTGPVAVDAERASGYRYGQSAYLVQLRREGAGTALIDPQALPDLSELSAAIAPAEWVLHAASQDLPCLAEVGMKPTSLFDTELAARLLGYERVGLATMVAAELGLELAKEHSAADWSTRPLPEDWLRYAALDVEVLIELRAKLAAELAEAGKLDWATEEFEAVRTAGPPPPRRDPWRRTSGSHQVRDGLGLAIVRELWIARDAEARSADIAQGRILTDAAIVAAAVNRPATMPEMAQLPGFRTKNAARRMRTWFAALQRAKSLNPSSYPSRRAPASDALPPPKAWKDRNPDGAQRLVVVRSTVRTLAEELHLPQENLLTPEYQRRLAWSPPHDLSTASVADSLRELGARDWQVRAVAGPLSHELLAAAD
ncbi:MAG TPA: HRDC domain-containing protein [Candidatus Ruania gallistercoris]|uniref:HRDC domain-containing protein n=1 Tax=Candidatus Ruania gallistercoris TaxID=2838746 RepID=A0A9D2EDX1_9MICO|nr:HRDC domain-containing protein [Candidatus Ruania gallistercoris]